jgi:hypothetical protein
MGMIRRSTIIVPETGQNNIPLNRRSTIAAPQLPKVETYGLSGISKMTENARRTILVNILIISETINRKFR